MEKFAVFSIDAAAQAIEGLVGFAKRARNEGRRWFCTSRSNDTELVDMARGLIHGPSYAQDTTAQFHLVPSKVRLVSRFTRNLSLTIRKVSL